MVELLERFRLEVSHREQSALGHVSPCIRFPSLVRQPAGEEGAADSVLAALQFQNGRGRCVHPWEPQCCREFLFFLSSKP